MSFQPAPPVLNSFKLPPSPELLAPAGNWDCAKAAIENGADAIYFGLDQFNARMRADNFQEADLAELMNFLHSRGVKGYVTFNTLVFPQELERAEQYLRRIITAGVDAAIVQDVGLCRLIRHLSPDFPIHASTQMTVTSGAGVEFARSLGCNLVVLARECSINEINRIQQDLGDKDITLPLEVFVHGALCVAYSGQCLTSEALGGRSANRGECAQACRMPYELVVEGKVLDLGDRKYLLSPQDLAGLAVLPELIAAGVTSLKIEGRLKTPEYVAAVTQTYRQAIDGIVQGKDHRVTDQEHYRLEMAFSRGLYTGWLQGIDNQALVHAQFAKKRGVYLGEISRIQPGRDTQIALALQAPVKPGDGVVFVGRQGQEVGGRVYGVEQRGRETLLSFGRREGELRRVRVGDRLWKTSDPHLDQQLRQSFTREQPQFQRPIEIEVQGRVGAPLTAIVREPSGAVVQVCSNQPLIAAHTQGLSSERLKEQLGRLGNTPFRLDNLVNQLEGAVLLPVSELNRLRREFVTQLEQVLSQPKAWQLQQEASYRDLLPGSEPRLSPSGDSPSVELIVLVRNLAQLDVALEAGMQTIYCEFENPRSYGAAVQRVRDSSSAQIWVAPPRITKPKEQYILEQVRAAEADGYLIRNYDHLQFFAGLPGIGDFSLNIANPLTASHFKQLGLERLTASYDLNIAQLEALLLDCPPGWLEVTIHQHMPMFHMEHCVFCAFLSNGTDYRNCGRPCEKYEVKLRDRAGVEHLLQADAGCRNTVFNGTAQTGAEGVQRLIAAGARFFRIEFVNETAAEVAQTIDRYQQLLRGQITGAQLWRELKLNNQLGVTRGTLD